MPAKPLFLKAPLNPNPFAPLPLTAVRPAGWLRRELELCAEGLSGHLHEFWPDVGDETAWLGGPGDDWERAPYYLDGLVPLAYLLDDERLKQEVQRRVDWILDSQREDGFFGPPSNEDWWPRAVAQKAVMQYYCATTDLRALKFLLKALHYMNEHLDELPLSTWGTARVGEMLYVALWVYGLTDRQFLLGLCNRLIEEGLDWTNFCHTLPLKTPMARHISWLELRRGMEDEENDIHRYYTREHHLHHVVNVAMGLKTPALEYALSGGIKHQEAFDVGFEKLMKYHGVAYGMFTGDELLSGNSPSQGTELCAVAELMFTLEVLLCLVGRPAYGDMLEKLAFNALPATLSPDRKTHQYVQQANQVLVDEHPRNWYNNNHEANLFGLEPHFGCCTANMHQAFPKYAASLWMERREGGLCAMSYAPCQVRYRIGDAPIRIDVGGHYPYDELVTLDIALRAPLKFPLALRIPEWAQGATVSVGGETWDCEAGTYHLMEREWQHGDRLELRLPMQVRTSHWYHHSVAVERGPLLFALPLEERWEVLRDHPFSPDYAIHSDTPWNYALCPDRGFTVRFDPEGIAPFKHGRAVSIEAFAAPLPDWQLRAGSADQPPIDPAVESAQVVAVTLVPYGDTSLRVSQFPEGQERSEP